MQSDDRRQALQGALKKLERNGTKVSVSAVAREVGVTPALIHNRYPDIADKIRGVTGKSTRKKASARLEKIHTLKRQLEEVRAERDEAKRDVTKLASLNLALKLENDALRAAATSGKVTPIKR